MLYRLKNNPRYTSFHPPRFKHDPISTPVPPIQPPYDAQEQYEKDIQMGWVRMSQVRKGHAIKGSSSRGTEEAKA